jgi:hypothetical protein
VRSAIPGARSGCVQAAGATLAGTPPTSSAISGGTRAYQGAAGTVIVKSSPTKGDTVTVQFAP